MLDGASEQPLYLQLVDQLEMEIRNSMLANDKLSSERELTKMYGVSRITVRLALQELEKRGLSIRSMARGPMCLKSAIRLWICQLLIVLRIR